MLTALGAMLVLQTANLEVALVVPNPRVLVFSKTAGFRHDSIPVGAALIQDLGREKGFRVVHTEDASVFNAEALKGVDVVVFLSTTGDVLNSEQEKAFEDFIISGGGFVGIHAAADTEYEWPFYGRTVGGYFKTHPRIQPAKVIVEDRSHATTHFLPKEWMRTDEWYTYRVNPRGKVNVVCSLDESTYEGGGMDGDHPITWWHEVGQGRAWYTGFGHTKESYSEPDFQRMLAEAIVWAAQGKRPEGAEDVSWTSIEGWGIEKDVRGGVTFPVMPNKPGANKHLISDKPHGDVHLHLEFKIPKGSNSGVYLMGRYEVQILDSSGKEAKDLQSSDCGGIYERWGPNGGFEGKPPLANAFAGPGKWNTYDILFRAPRFDGNRKVANAKFVEVRLNGVVVQKNVEVTGPTRAPLFETEAPAGQLMLQGDHGPIVYRNVWMKR